MVDKGHPSLNIRRQGGLLGLNRSTLYHQPQGESPDMLALMRHLDELFMEGDPYMAAIMEGIAWQCCRGARRTPWTTTPVHPLGNDVTNRYGVPDIFSTDQKRTSSVSTPSGRTTETTSAGASQCDDQARGVYSPAPGRRQVNERGAFKPIGRVSLVMAEFDFQAQTA